MLTCYYMDHEKQTSVKIYSKLKHLHSIKFMWNMSPTKRQCKNVVCEVAAILSWPQCVNGRGKWVLVVLHWLTDQSSDHQVSGYLTFKVLIVQELLTVTNHSSHQLTWHYFPTIIVLRYPCPGPVFCLCSTNHRPVYWSNLPCDWLSTAWAYSEQETENGPWCNKVWH